MRCVVVIPCYNEEENISFLVQRISTCLTNLEYMIVAVDDGSNDHTLLILEDLRLKHPLRIIRHRHNMGFSKAIESGLYVASEDLEEDDIVVTMDADMTHDPCAIQPMLRKINDGFDLVIASRYVKDGAQPGLSLHRRLLSRSINLVVSRLFNLGIKDATSGFRCWRMRLLKELIEMYSPNLLESRGFEGNLELLMKAVKLDARVAEVPVLVDYGRKRGRSKMRLVRTILNYLRLTINLLLSGCH